ncbi:hypothetical protein MNB_SUP05-SYMBIONT-7-98 [hydrothermal vent metagenome]|uniref:Uncharacterized protein n=1 Tax=hydrothermal vent metagenome TaxID=652676 RepID=A0A1W1E3D7_9ZZZZ
MPKEFAILLAISKFLECRMKVCIFIKVFLVKRQSYTTIITDFDRYFIPIHI